MLTKLRARLKGETPLRSVAWAAAQMFGSRLLGQLAGFAVAVLVARELGPAAFGLYSFMLVVALLLASVPGTGLDMAAVRLCSRDWLTNPQRARGMLLVSGVSKGLCVLALALAALLLAGPLLGGLLERPHLVPPLQAAAPGAVALAMTEFFLAALQTQERFGLMFAINLAVAAIKVVPVAVLAALGLLTLPAAMALFVITAYASALLSLLAAWRTWRGVAHWSRATLRELVVFGRWLVLSTILGVMTTSLDVLALTHLAGAHATGIYASGRNLGIPISIAAAAVGMVLLPRLSRLSSPAEIRRYVAAINPRLAVVAGLMSLGMMLAAPLLVHLAYGADYRAAAGVLQVLTLAYAIQMFVWPSLAALMVFNRPDIITALSFFVICFIAVGYVLVVPSFGAVGAAWVLVVGYACTIVPYLLAVRQLGRQHAPVVPTEAARS
jgi:O-antigen/teichoic acid export membrane protein